jgi:hypothetical protein
LIHFLIEVKWQFSLRINFNTDSRGWAEKIMDNFLKVLFLSWNNIVGNINSHTTSMSMPWIFSEDAPALEASLHTAFHHRRVNLINFTVI